MRRRFARALAVLAVAAAPVVLAVAAAPVVPAVAAALPPTAQAAVTSVFAGQTVSGGAIPCKPQSDGVRVCHGAYTGVTAPDLRLKSFDGTPLEVYVILPPAPSTGTDGGYPLIVQSHGWGGSAGGPTDTEFYGPTADALAKDGYAVLQLTARGFSDSCGQPQFRTAACINGYIRLDDDRYEVRDIQNAVGLLVDEAIADPARIGVTGESYGGGVSLQLATLKDRFMAPDGSLHPWTSPGGTPLQIAAAAPVIPWSDLVYSLVPNGRTLDTAVTQPTQDLAPVGVEKQSFVSGLFALGSATGYYAPPGTNPEADLTSWYATLNAGEPYETNAQVQAALTQIAKYHSAYYLLSGAYGTGQEPPAPLLIANGFSDDLFPVDEAVRYYNLERSLYPTDPISLFDGDFGHQRAQNKDDVTAALSGAIAAFFDHYVKGTGPQPAVGVTAFTETCPADAPSGGPFTASSWSALAPGAVDFQSTQPQTVSSAAGDPTIGHTLDPITGGGACATVPAQDQGTGVATYRLPAATGSGYTLLGAPIVSANLQVSGSYPYLAARLFDVDPSSGSETLVARGVYRLDPSNPNGTQNFQLHPGAWHFAAGHVAKLELLGQDAPYLRPSNGNFSIVVNTIAVRLPVHESPGSSGVTPPTNPVIAPPVPPGPGPGRPKPCRRLWSRIDKHRVHASRRGISLRGIARQPACASASATGNPPPHVARVYVMIYKTRPGGRCEFLTRRGKLTRPRPCSHPVEFRARGTSHWKLRLKVRVPRGVYLIRADAVDSLHRHQRHSGPSVALRRVR